VKQLCQVLGIARSSYYHWRATALNRAARAAADARLLARVRAVRRDSAGIYGVPRIIGELRATSDHGSQCSARVFADACRAGVTRSMGAVGSSADDAPAESLNASLCTR